MPNTENPGFIPPHGGYQNLLSFKKAEIIYDGTMYFTKRFFIKGDRTIDQMVQAARSGKQNIGEASMASGTSKETEIKLTSVARGSLEELKLDYEDFLRNNNLAAWDVNSKYVARLRQLNKITDATYETFKKGIENPDPAICANVMIGLIKTATYLLDRQLKALEIAFIKNGGMREQMTKARLDYRNRQKQ